MMTAENVNRTFYLRKSHDIDNMLLEIATLGHDTMGTKEIVNARLIVFDAEIPHVFMWHQGVNQVVQLFNAISDEDPNFKSEIYDSKYYTFLNKEIKNAVLKREYDCDDTRRCVVSFPSSHCFESIQVLVRNNIGFITVNMRSCNAKKNLMCDLLLSYFIAKRMVGNMLIKSWEMIANIGSLHVFKEDIKHVL